jgi:hypothetical protein
MAIEKVPRHPEELELLRLYSAVDPVQNLGASLRDAARLDEFVVRARTSLERSLLTPSRLHGLRAEALFRATLIALGRFRLLADEDAGQPYYDAAGGRVSPPDFRVVDNDNAQLLVEVKSVKNADPLKPAVLRSADVAAWGRWGNLTGTPVAVAFWWATPGIWTLVDVDRLTTRGTKLEIGLAEAVAVNEMSRFDDCLLATIPPLTLRLHVDNREASDDPSNAGSAAVTCVEILAAGHALTDELERRIAFFLLRFGRWEVEQELQFGADGNVVTIDLVGRPPQPADAANDGQPFASVGMLSSLYAALFTEATISIEGDVDQLDHRPRPGELADLIPDDFWDRPGRVLPIWRLVIEPAEPSS